MKKTVFVFVLLCLVSSSAALAHPPSDIKTQYDPATQTLKAVIEHPVSNASTHYIDKVDISINGKEVQELKFQSQETPGSQTLEIQLKDVKSGDLLSVEGYCNLSGKLEKEIKIA